MSSTPIRDLTAASSIDASTLIPVVPGGSSTTQKATLQQVLTLFQALFANPSFTRLTAAPTGSGETVDLSNRAASDLWLIVSPTVPVAVLNIAPPSNVSSTTAFDGQTIIVTNGGSSVTTLNFVGSAAVSGAPTSLPSGGFFALRYDVLTNGWYCVSQSLGSNNSFTDIVVAGSILDAAGAVLLGFTSVASADNFVSIRNGTAGVFIEALGADAAVPLSIQSKGAAQALFQSPSGTVVIQAPAGSVNITGASAINLSGAVSGDAAWATTGVSSAVALKSTGSTVAALPAAAAGNRGERRHVTDATQALTAGIGAVVAGGGANIVPVFSDGTNWRIGG